VLAVIFVADTTFTAVAVPLPKVTVAPAAKLLPLIATEVPPAAGPLLGETPVTVVAVSP